MSMIDREWYGESRENKRDRSRVIQGFVMPTLEKVEKKKGIMSKLRGWMR